MVGGEAFLCRIFMATSILRKTSFKVQLLCLKACLRKIQSNPALMCKKDWMDGLQETEVVAENLWWTS